ncbi:MAG: glycosyltransferase [Opitutales bacterium]
MKTDKPWMVLHLDLERKIPSLSSQHELAGVYMVLWMDDIPLGELWLSTEQLPMPATQLREQVLKTVTPAIGDRLLKNGFKAYPSLDSQSDPADLLSLEKLLKSLKRIASTAIDQRPLRTTSVVICTRDRPESLERCLRSLQELSPSPEEILVVDNAPRTDATFMLVSRMPLPGLRYILEPRTGLDIARNTGVRESSGEIIAFTDDDVIAHPSWLRHIQNGFMDSRVMAVTGLVLAAEVETEAQSLFERTWGFNRGYRRRTFDSAFFARTRQREVPVEQIGAGANMAFRRRCFDLAGGFDERLDVGAAGCSGDSEFWYKVLAKGWICQYEPSAVVSHYHRRELRDLNRQIYYYTRGHAAALLIQFEKHGDRGNLRRLFWTLPRYYLRSFLSLLIKGATAQNRTVVREVSGYLSGILYYLRHARDETGEGNVGSPEALQNPQQDRSAYALSTEGAPEARDSSLVSVIIPCYNHGHFLAAAIESAVRQTYPHIEIIVVDDGSTDDTANVARRYGSVRYVKQANQGLSAARNTGMLESTGRYLVFLDADDRLVPSALETGIRCFQARPECGFISGAHVRVTPDGVVPVSPEKNRFLNDPYEAFLRGNHVGMHATVMYRRDILESVGGFNTSLPACEDYDVYLQIARRFPVAHHEKVVAEYYIHGENMSANLALMLATVLRVLQKQKDYIRHRSNYRKSYRMGIRAWKEYYGAILWEQAKTRIVRGRITAVALCLLTLARYAPQWLLWRAASKVKQSGFEVVKALLPLRLVQADRKTLLHSNRGPAITLDKKMPHSSYTPPGRHKSHPTIDTQH